MNSAPAGAAGAVAAADPAPSSNLLLNPGFEEPSPGPTDPFVTPARCWQEWRTPQSTHKPTFALSAAPNVHGGAAALSATYPGTDVLGFSALVALPDMGTCAVPATPGHVYRFSGWYKSTRPGVRDAPGAPEHERRLDAGGRPPRPLAPAADWTRFTVDLPAVPDRRHGHRARRPVQGRDDVPARRRRARRHGAARGRHGAGPGPRHQRAGRHLLPDGLHGVVSPRVTSVTLTATPTGNASFTGWSGACTGTGPCTVALTEARAVVAAFLDPANPQGVKHKLTIARAGAGKGTVSSTAPKISCKKACNVQVLENTKVRLTAKAQKGSVFLGWKGACKGAGACEVVLSKNVKVTALFEPLKPGLRDRQDRCRQRRERRPRHLVRQEVRRQLRPRHEGLARRQAGARLALREVERRLQGHQGPLHRQHDDRQDGARDVRPHPSVSDADARGGGPCARPHRVPLLLTEDALRQAAPRARAVRRPSRRRRGGRPAARA